MTKEKATPPEKKAALEMIRSEFTGNDCHTQRLRLVRGLSIGPLNSDEARRFLDVYYPPARIFELRSEGLKITTHWQTVETEAGETHRVGLYVLEGQP
jgi:hypothetical protein